MSMKMPKADPAAKAWFEALVPEAPGVRVRPMFGQLAAFVNGNMFLTLFGASVAVRLSEKDRALLLKEKGAAAFEPMPGRPMKEYVVLPEAWRTTRVNAIAWVDRSLGFTSAMPAKAKPKKK